MIRTRRRVHHSSRRRSAGKGRDDGPVTSPEQPSALVLALYAGRAAPLRHGRTTVTSAVVKRPVAGAADVRTDGLVGDEQADRKNHGGPGKALLVYPSEHYAERPSPAFGLPVGSLGENVSTDGLVESDVRVGDVFSLGEALLQVSQPRRPCFKMAARHGLRHLPVQMQDAGHTGYYLRVLVPGQVVAGQRMMLERRPEHGVTVADVNRVLNVDKDDLAGAAFVLTAADDLPEAWRVTLRQRLAQPGGAAGDDDDRLFGT
jgi:MOSC domain-containing protein YiiM